MIKKRDIVIPDYPHKFAGLKCRVEDTNCLNGDILFIRPVNHEFTYGLFIHPDFVKKI